MALVPSKTSFVVAARDGALDTQAPQTPPPPGTTALSIAAASMSAGDVLEFPAGELPAQCLGQAHRGEKFVYWNAKFHWDATHAEAQVIGIGTGFSPFGHALYSDSGDAWQAIDAFDPVAVLGTPPYGHPYSWHTLTPDGTYWVQRSSTDGGTISGTDYETLMYRTRDQWTTNPTGPWRSEDRTTAWPCRNTADPNATNGWPGSIDWHDAMGRAIFRNGRSVFTLDLEGFLASGNLDPTALAIHPIATSKFYAGTGYCTAIDSLLCFGSSASDQCYAIDAAGVMSTYDPPPRLVLNGNITLSATDTNKYAIYVDDPTGAAGYLLERQPLDSVLPNKVWKMSITAGSWDGTWTEVGTHTLFHSARGDGRLSGGTCVVAPVTTYGVVWCLRQRSVDYTDSVLWKPI